MVGAQMRRLGLLLFALATIFLVVGAPGDASGKGRRRRRHHHQARPWGAPERLKVPNAPDAYYYEPATRHQRPILMYLHGHGGHPASDCKKWWEVARRFGWLVCPIGPGSDGKGGRTWSTGPADAARIIDATVHALRKKFGRRPQLYGNVLIGFSEGAFIAMQVGLNDQRTWNRWLILGASDEYWSKVDAKEKLGRHRKVRRVYLLTGKNDGVREKTKRVGKFLKKLHVRTIIKIVPEMGHEVPPDLMTTRYRRPLLWLTAD